MDAKEFIENASVRRAEIKRLENLQKLVEPLLQDADHLNKLEYKLQRCTSTLLTAHTDNKQLRSKLTALKDALAHQKDAAAAASAADTYSTRLAQAQMDCQLAAANRRIADMQSQCLEEAERRADADSRARVLLARFDTADRAAQNALKAQRAAEGLRDAARKETARVRAAQMQTMREEHARKVTALKEQCEAYRSRCEQLELRVRELEKTPLTTPLPTPRATPGAPAPVANALHAAVPLDEWDLISPAPLMRVRSAGTDGERAHTPPRVPAFGREIADGVSESESRSRDTADMPFVLHDMFYDVPREDANGRPGEEGEEVLPPATGDSDGEEEEEEEEVDIVPMTARNGSRKRPFASRRTRVRARSAGTKRPRRPHAPRRKDAETPTSSLDEVPAVGNTATMPVSSRSEEALKAVNPTPNGNANGKLSANEKETSDATIRTSRKPKSKTPPKPTDAPRAPAQAAEPSRRSRRARAPVSYDLRAGNDICTSLYDFMPYRSGARAAAPQEEEGGGGDRSRKRRSLPAGYRAPAEGSPIRKGRRRGGRSARNT